MAFRDMIPWSKQQLAPSRDAFDPFFTLHREMNRLFDDALRGFGQFGSLDRLGSPMMEGRFSWPKIELSETDRAVTVSAELPGLTEKDVQLEIANGVLTIRGEKKTERSDDAKFFTERYYGAFERQVPLDSIDADKVQAEFRNGVLTVTLPKSEQARDNVRRIAINAK